MGITAGPSYTTDEGFVISPLYLSVNSMRFTVTADGDLHCVYTVRGYKSRADKKAGRNAINPPQNLSLMDTFVNSSVLANQNMYTVTYLAIKKTWGLAGFQVDDVIEPGQPGYVEREAADAAATLAATERAAADAAATLAATERAAALAAEALAATERAEADAAAALALANPTNSADQEAAVAADAEADAAEAVAVAADAAADAAEAVAVVIDAAADAAEAAAVSADAVADAAEE
jgi:hypothetical protein